jgi:hypothetical protein
MAMPGPAQPRWRDWLSHPVLIGIVALGLAVRLHGLSFGLPAMNDPDELIFELGAVKMLVSRTLNPGWFGHPATTTMYVLAILDVMVFVGGLALGKWSGPQAFTAAIYRDPGLVVLPHRVVMVLFALGTIILTARLAARIWQAQGQKAAAAGLIAAALLMANPVHAGWSQVIRSDLMACFFMLLALLAACDVVERDRRSDWFRAAAWLGLAIATKWPFALGYFALVGAAVSRLRDGHGLKGEAIRLIQAGFVMVAVLLAACPYLVISWHTVVANLAGEAQQQHLGATGGTPIENLGWYLRFAVWPATGLVGLVLAAAGGWAGRGNRLIVALLLPVAAAFLVAMTAQHIVWDRWALPLMPMLGILAAGGVVWLYRLTGERRAPAGVVLAAALVPLVSASWIRGTERLHDTRQEATAWAHAHIPPGSSIMVEHFAFDLLAGDWRFLYPLGDRGCMDAGAALAGQIRYDTIDRGRGKRSNVDYGTLPANMRPTCAADWAILTQADRYAAESERFPAEWAAYRDLINSGVTEAVFAPRPGENGGPVVRIVHFRR